QPRHRLRDRGRPDALAAADPPGHAGLLLAVRRCGDALRPARLARPPVAADGGPGGGRGSRCPGLISALDPGGSPGVSGGQFAFAESVRGGVGSRLARDLMNIRKRGPMNTLRMKRLVIGMLVGAVVGTVFAGAFVARAADPIKIGLGMALTGGLS